MSKTWSMTSMTILDMFLQHHKFPWNIHRKYLVAERNVQYRMWCLLENPIQPTSNVAYIMLNNQWNGHMFGFYNSEMCILKFIQDFLKALKKHTLLWQMKVGKNKLQHLCISHALRRTHFLSALHIKIHALWKLFWQNLARQLMTCSTQQGIIQITFCTPRM